MVEFNKNSYSSQGYSLLEKINNLLKIHHPQEYCASYKLTVSRTVHNQSLSFSPTLQKNFLKSIHIRHKICHFKPITKNEYNVLLTLYTEFEERYKPQKENKKMISRNKNQRNGSNLIFDDYLSGYGN